MQLTTLLSGSQPSLSSQYLYVAFVNFIHDQRDACTSTSTPNYRVGKLFMAILLFTHRICFINLLRSLWRNIFFKFHFVVDVTAKLWTTYSCLRSQQTTYYNTAPLYSLIIYIGSLKLNGISDTVHLLTVMCYRRMS